MFQKVSEFTPTKVKSARSLGGMCEVEVDPQGDQGILRHCGSQDLVESVKRPAPRAVLDPGGHSMKLLFGRFELVALTAVFGLASCTGTGGGGEKSPPDEPMPPVQPGSLERNPTAPLTCDRSLFENPSASQMSRLTPKQYTNTLKDLFVGLVEDSAMPKQENFEEQLAEGLYSNNVLRQLGSTPITDAREEAVLKITESALRDLPKLMGCQPKDASAESGCVDTFLENFGLRAWRRPPTKAESDSLKALFAAARKDLEYNQSVRTVMGAMLQSPQFLFRVQEGTGDVGEGMTKKLTDFEVASNLSYLFWNTMPDKDLFDSAKKGNLSTSAQVEAQARRMVQDPRTRESLRQFQHEWLQTARLETQANWKVKDRTDFASYGQDQYDALIRGFDAFLDEAFWEGDKSMKNLFTSSKGFVNDASADIYGVSKPGTNNMTKVDLNPSQRKGLLTQPFIMAGWAGEKAQSGILRGVFVMDHLLCAPAPPPPDDVATEIKDVPNRDELTYRQVVEMTVEQGKCAGCHKTIDGYGFLFENYDAVGAYKTKERNLNIDASGEVAGTLDLNRRYNNGLEFTEQLAKSEQVAQCVVQNFYEYATARGSIPEDGCMIAPLTDAFLKSGTNLQEILVEIAKSPALRFRSAAQ